MLMTDWTSREWQAGRNRFNHDWLKNKFLLSLDRLVRISEDKIEDEEEYASRFLASGLSDWIAEKAAAAELIETFEMAMSPQVFLDREPLCRCTHREWLRGVVHALWISRVGAAQLIETARSALDRASAAYDELSDCLEQYRDRVEITRLGCCRPPLIAFRDQCRALASAFEKFPHRIMVA